MTTFIRTWTAVAVALGLQALPQLEPQADLHLAAGIHAKRALERPTAGISLAITRDRSATPFVIRAFGLADVDRKMPATPQTIFQVGPIAEYIVAGVTMRLAQDGVLSLDDDITKYVPDAPTQGRRVTLRHLLQQTSGIGDGQAIAFEPGSAWRYSRAGVQLVSAAIERVSGQPFAFYMQEHVFRPLRMDSTSICAASGNASLFATGTEMRDGALAAMRPVATVTASRAICSTAQDLLKWQTALQSGRFIASTAVKEMRNPAVLTDGTPVDYGLGTRLGTLQGRRVIGQAGSEAGFDGVLAYFPDDGGLTMAVLTNTAHGGAEAVAAATARSAFELGGAPVAAADVLFADAARAQPPAQAGNPILQGWYADPEAHVFNGEYWIYPTYSAPYDQQTFMDAFSSRDLVTWTKHPRILDAARVKWATRAMWAPSIVEKDGWYYLFFGANDIQNDQQIGGIGVARARQPSGPFEDYLGKPLIDRFHNGAQPIDQFVFKDRDGAHYIVYGGWRHCNIARLKDDFTGLVPFADGSTVKEITPQGYVEGAFMLQKDGKYYFMWSEGGWTGPNYAVAYAVGSSPFGPFERVGKILQQDPEVATGAGHHSVLHVDGSGKWYIVYHRRPLGDTDRNHRVVCIDELKFDEKGAIVPVRITTAGVAADPLPPVKR